MARCMKTSLISVRAPPRCVGWPEISGWSFSPVSRDHHRFARPIEIGQRCRRDRERMNFAPSRTITCSRPSRRGRCSCWSLRNSSKTIWAPADRSRNFGSSCVPSPAGRLINRERALLAAAGRQKLFVCLGPVGRFLRPGEKQAGIHAVVSPSKDRSSLSG